MPPTVFPVNSVKAMRGCLWLSGQERSEQRLPNFARECFEAYWSRDEDISQDEVLKCVCMAAGEDPSALLAGIAGPAIKEQLKVNTDELIARGGFGSPTMFLDGGDMYFGNDRLELLRAAILRKRAATLGP
jgi:2-hydroxychromene-2-carboxylate isomerase